MNRYLMARGVVFGLILSLAGCGGGGGGGGGGGDAPASVNPAPGADASGEIHGVASKGLLKGARVTAYTLDEQGARTRALVTATTDEAGLYTLSVPSDFAGGIVEIVVVADAATARMVCDVVAGCANTAFGSDAMLDETLTMSALVNIVPGQLTPAVNVTPLSNMVAARVRGLGTVNAATLESALSEAKNLFNGADLFSVVAVDLTKPQVYKEDPLALTAAVVNSALARVAYQRRVSIASVVDLLATSFRDGSLVAKAADASDGSELALETWLSAIIEQYRGIGLVDRNGVVARLKQLVAKASLSQTLVDPQPSPNLGKTDSEKAKAFAAELRSWFTVAATLIDPSESGVVVSGPSTHDALLLASNGGTALLASDYVAATAGKYALVAFMALGGQVGTYDVGTNVHVVIARTADTGKLYATVSVYRVDFGRGVQVRGRADVVLQLPEYDSTVGSVTLPFFASISATDNGFFNRKLYTTTSVKNGSLSISFATSTALNRDNIAALESNVTAIGVGFDLTSTLEYASTSFPPTPPGITITGHCFVGAQGSFSGPHVVIFKGDLASNCDGLKIATANGAALTSFDVVAKGVHTTLDTADWIGAAVSFETQLARLQNALVTFSYTLDQVDRQDIRQLHDPTLTASLAFENDSLAATANYNEDGGTPSAKLRLVNQDGVILDIQRRDGAITGNMLAVDGTVLATLSNAGKLYKISYTDGTFESLN